MERLITIGEAERKVKEYLYDENEEAVYRLIQQVLSQEKVIGSIDDFHNLSVNFSRRDDYETACNILDKGLEQFPKAVDLLADYLQNGINCNRVEQCEKCFRWLMSIPKMRWTWRGFSFGIEYMKNRADYAECESELYNFQIKMLELVDSYYKYFPYNEDVFLVKASIYQYFNNLEKEVEVLENALESLKSCPKCLLRLSDIAFEKGDYDKALKYIDKCKVASVQTQEKINQGYMYYLSGLCKVAKIHEQSAYEDEDAVKDIYYDLCLAEKMKINFVAYKKVIDRQINILEVKSGISYDSVMMKIDF